MHAVARRLCLGVSLGFATIGVPPSAFAQIPDAFTNLQHFPKDITRGALVAQMRTIATSLGVRCTTSDRTI